MYSLSDVNTPPLMADSWAGPAAGNESTAGSTFERQQPWEEWACGVEITATIVNIRENSNSILNHRDG